MLIGLPVFTFICYFVVYYVNGNTHAEKVKFVYCQRKYELKEANQHTHKSWKRDNQIASIHIGFEHTMARMTFDLCANIALYEKVKKIPFVLSPPSSHCLFILCVKTYKLAVNGSFQPLIISVYSTQCPYEYVNNNMPCMKSSTPCVYFIHNKHTNAKKIVFFFRWSCDQFCMTIYTRSFARHAWPYFLIWNGLFPLSLSIAVSQFTRSVSDNRANAMTTT